MSEITTVDERLVVHIETDALPAEDLANLIQAVDRSFSGFSRGRVARGSKPRLAVRSVEHGSIVLILEAIEGLGKVVAAGPLIASWTSHIADLANWWILAKPPKLSPVDRKLAEAISHPVASDHATQINIVHNGNVVIAIGPDEASRIVEALTTARPAPRTAANAALRPMLDDESVVQLEGGSLIGTALLVDGAWYARLEGLRGVLVPVRSARGADDMLVHGKPYMFAGAPERGTRGETVGISLKLATPLG